MDMSFEAGTKVTILFDGWTTENTGELIGSAIAVMVLAFGFEAVKHWRQNLARHRTGDIVEVSGIFLNLVHRDHVCQTILHFVQFGIGYLLMLIAMTFNVWLFLAVVVGSTLGYFTFGWRRHTSEWTENCHG